MLQIDRPKSLSLWKRQVAACATFGLLLASIIAALCLQHRQREWVLRREQAHHRLEIVCDLISREVARVRADAMYLANRDAIREFLSVETTQRQREDLTADFLQFVQQKTFYDQIRLLDLKGYETLRVNFSEDSAKAVDENELQDKSDRYYFQEATSLRRDEVFVSEFDLNLEHGQIEQPLKPVIRFVVPVYDQSESVAAYLVLNYLGKELLNELNASTIPGYTLLLRRDGHYICGQAKNDQWGWLLGHDRTFAQQFPREWSMINRLASCQLTANGAFAKRTIPLGRLKPTDSDPNPRGDLSGSQPDAPTNAAPDSDSITVVSFLPREIVFATSFELFQRLMIFASGVFALVIVFTRAWARATLSRQQQAERIAASEERLRELSSRLLRIQEEERRAISREIHDELGQQATAISLDLRLAQRNMASENAMPHLQRAIHENETLLRTMHEFAKRVRPAVLDDLGLEEAIDSHLQEFAKRTGVEVDAQLELPAREIPDEIAGHSYRLVQESLNNVAKHAGASKVEIKVGTMDDPNRHLQIFVRDNGCGQDETETHGGLGIIGMRERVELLGGKLNITSSKNCGTTVLIELPLCRDQEGEVACP